MNRPEADGDGVPWPTAPAALAVLTGVGAVQAGRSLPVALGLGVAVLATSAVLARRRAAGWPVVVALTVPAAGVAAACWGDPRNLGWFGVCVVVGWAALAAPPRPAVLAGAATAAVFVVQLVTVSREPGWLTWIAGTTFTVGACAFARRQRDLVERLHAAHSELAQRARTDERHRIAREMHDLVGHSLTVTLLHLGSARLALDDDRDAARASLTEAERAARDSLDDVRAAVGLMRAAGPPAALPAPTATDIAALVERYRRAGARVELDVRGDLGTLSPNRSLAAYRIVQESLTNAVRHGDGSPIGVRVDVAGGRARITVRNAAPARPHRVPGTGVVAMRERAGALGGHLTAGPDDGGWLVEAVIPG
ncbi:histidine kinase [Georgenia sp. TF02-10]|uniref:sensor histidine kinase n=1 Tax=Georgenia sp. TF02-10 TaxID=2917725 RepID=UPI001FA7D7B9|nr:histidine kinase [Georgenia sp. TF02-10]UNX53491.1 histidine kinase [Georgenia sp. TF02-10]